MTGAAWPTVEERAALLRKYRLLAAWRRRADATLAEEAADEAPDEAPDEAKIPDNDDANEISSEPRQRAELRAISREFPGALRELDVLGLPEILRRVDRLADRDETHPLNEEHDDRWMAWIAAYHFAMRAALTIKRISGRQRDLSATLLSEKLAHLPTHPGVQIDEAFVRAVVHPPAGRLGIVVLNALAARFQIPAAEISRTLFPPRRPPPYDLG